MERPSYSSSRRYLWSSFAGAWLVILLLVAGAICGVDQAVALGNIALPAMFAIITGNLAVHRGFGSVDFRAQNKEQPAPDRGRDEPDHTAAGIR